MNARQSSSTLAMASTPSPREREMTSNKRGLVETCFEEGQYQSGIAVLEQLRSESFKPPVSLIRQILYIALYPTPSSDVEERDFDPASPSKGSPTKRGNLSKVTFGPSVDDSEAAQHLLLSFVRTNTPMSLFQALPQPRVNGACNELPFGSDDHDSVVAKESLCIKDAKHCWAMLKEGFVPRIKTSSSSAPTGKRQRGKISTRAAQHVEDNVDDMVLAPVADHAWLVLQWLVELFQRDQYLTSGDASANYSPLLLLQIPPPRSGTGPRWEADAPLDIVFHCVSRRQPQQRHLGFELMTLLIHVSLTAEFDFSMFLEQVASRLYSAPSEIVQAFLSGLHISHSVQMFKQALCRKFLSDESGGRSASIRRPKPQARAVRAARGAVMTREDSSPSIADDSSTSSVASKIPLPPAGDIVRLLTLSSGCSPTILTVKKEFLISYGYLQQVAERRDREWQQLVAGGRLESLVTSIFSGDSYALQDRDALISLMRIWAMN